MEISEAAPSGFDAAKWDQMLAEGRTARFRDGELICMIGDACKGWPFVVSGAIRVYAMSEEGREITLYRIEPGVSCILTATCILGEHSFPAYASAIGDTEILLLPPQSFQKWFTDYPPWRRHVCGLLTERLVNVISVLEEVAFHRMDRRVAEHLLRDVDGDDTIHATHAALAADLGTSREVVSRILKDLEKHDVVELGRGTVRIVDREALLKIADPLVT